MGVELLLLHAALMLILGPAVVLYGIVAVARRRVRLIGSKVIGGASAAVTGIIAIVAGAAFSSFLWYMMRFYRD